MPIHFKHYALLTVVTAAVLAAAGAVLQSPIDLLSGATPKAQRAASDKLQESYQLVFAPSAPLSADSAVLTNAIRHPASGLPALSEATLHLSIPDNDPPLAAYTEKLARRFQQAGYQLYIHAYDPLLLRSRIAAGRYELALVPDKFLSADPDGSVYTLKYYEMR